MDGQRLTASPRRRRSAKRVSADERRPSVDKLVNSVKKLQRREIDSKLAKDFSMRNAPEMFRNIRLMEEYDIHEPKGDCAMVLPFLMNRTKVTEIAAARDIVFVLVKSGLCAAYSRVTNERICFLNAGHDEVIRSLFYNKYNDSLITVLVYAADNFNSLKCRSTKIDDIKRGQPDAGFGIFESESLKHPSYIEIDDVNGIVLTYSAENSIYKVFDLKRYTMLYSISGKDVEEIKTSPGIVLVIFNRASSHVPLKMLSVEDGTVLKSFKLQLHCNKKVQLIEQFNEKLFVKQENEKLQILNVHNMKLTEVSLNEFTTLSGYICLFKSQLFLTFRNGSIAVWNFRGELVTSIEGPLLLKSDRKTNNIHVSNAEDLIISYCKADAEDQGPDVDSGGVSININNIQTGRCLAKINVDNGCPNAEEFSNDTSMRNRVADALRDITAIFYDEQRNEIYSGNMQGLVHMWSN
ncbi:unnamed protein product [Rhodiola kirilowii]